MGRLNRGIARSGAVRDVRVRKVSRARALLHGFHSGHAHIHSIHGRHNNNTDPDRVYAHDMNEQIVCIFRGSDLLLRYEINHTSVNFSTSREAMRVPFPTTGGCVWS